MSKRPEVREIDVSVSLDDLLGPLGYGKKGDVDSPILEQILSEAERCERTMRGRAIYICTEIKPLPGRDAVETNGVRIEDETLAGSLDGARSLAVAVCTVGDGVDKLIDEHFGRGDFLRGMIVDVVGNRAVEDVAQRCAAFICAEAKELDLSTSSRLSPGYGRWEVSGQRAVFALLDPSPIGVSLNEHCMMQPRKSISFVIPLVKGQSRNTAQQPCQGCDFQDCSYRRV